MPIRIEHLVQLEQRSDAGAGVRGTGKELEEQGEVFGADALGGQHRVVQTVRHGRPGRRGRLPVGGKAPRGGGGHV
jgi:hypothetical protein